MGVPAVISEHPFDKLRLIDSTLKAVGTVRRRGAAGPHAGEILGRARSDSTIDALVLAETLIRGGGRVLTGDPDDLRKLAPYPNVAIHPL